MVPSTGGALHYRVLTMLALVIFVLAVYGLANAVGVLKVGEILRGTCENPKRLGRIPFFGKMFFCPACMGFWLGMAGSLWILSPSQQVVDVWWKAMVLDGLAGSAAAWMAHATTARLTAGLKI